MSIKQFVNHNAFDFLEPYGIKISSLSEVISKAKAGLIISSIKIIEVLFGLYSLKAVNIPLFLTFRRCGILTTMMVMYMWKGDQPGSVLVISSAFVVMGALVAGYETFDNNGIGYALIMGNNFGSAFVNVIAGVYNDKKLVNAFDLNFFFATIGLPLSYAIITYNGEIVKLQEIFFGNEKGELDMTMISYICISGSFGILITMTALLCVTINGPISMNITGIFKDVFLTIVGFLMFSDAKVTQSTLIGVGFSLVGATYFCWSKY